MAGDLSLVSILIPVCNCETWIGAAITSALAQTWPNKEVIVLDDGSTDRTADIVRAFGSQVFFHQQRLGGQNLARQRLTELSRGEWLVFLDADDELAADNIAQKMKFASQADFLYGSIEMARYRGRDKLNSQIEIAVDQEDLWVAAFNWWFPNTSAMMVRRATLNAVGGWPLELEYCTDYALYFRLILHNQRFRAAGKAYSLYRHWSNNQISYKNNFRKFMTKTQLLCWAGRQLNEANGFTARRLQVWSDRTMECVRLLYPHDSIAAYECFKCILEINPKFRPKPPTFSLGYCLAVRWFGFRAAQWLADRTRNRRKVWDLAADVESHPVMLRER
jgi:glycosyltransferase involved in cell wall biosynthesis